MPSKQKRNLMIVILLLILSSIILLITIRRDTAPPGMREISSYNVEGICAAIMPECGLCPGERIEDKCYVKKGSYEQYE